MVGRHISLGSLSRFWWEACVNAAHKFNGDVYGLAIGGFAGWRGASFDSCEAPAEEHGGG
jgi:hypothetical protein